MNSDKLVSVVRIIRLGIFCASASPLALLAASYSAESTKPIAFPWALPPASILYFEPPLTNATLVACQSVKIRADTNAIDGEVSRIDYYSGLDLLAGTSLLPPFEIQWTPTQLGPIAIRALVTTKAGSVRRSFETNVTIIEPGGFPAFDLQPESRSVPIGSNLTFQSSAQSTPVHYQWHRDGKSLDGETDAVLLRTAVQWSDAGYYTVQARNALGVRSSSPAYLAPKSQSGGTIWFDNLVVATLDAPIHILQDWFGPIYAQMYAGPVIDFMEPVGDPRAVSGSTSPRPGYFSGAMRQIPTVLPGSRAFVWTDVGDHVTARNRPSNTFALVTGNDSAGAVMNGLRFPYYLEWPTPFFYEGAHTFMVQAGSKVSLFVRFMNYTPVQIQWRKDGIPIAGVPTTSLDLNPYTGTGGTAILTLNDARLANAGCYSVVVHSDLYDHLVVSPDINLGVLIPEGGELTVVRMMPAGAFKLESTGIIGGRYRLETSSDFRVWETVTTLTNISGTLEFIDATATDHVFRYYRSTREE